jgi:CRISPR system Cascade subunit CasE
MVEMFLTRAHLRSDASVQALTDILLPKDNDARVMATHKLLWTLFADAAERKRDFLWREAKPGLFYLLSARPPQDRHNLFKLDPAKPFAPVLSPGARLAFSLRANPTVARKGEKDTKGRSKRADVVMDAIKPSPQSERAGKRTVAVQDAGEAWLRRQGERHGFAVEAVRVDRYRILAPPHRDSTMRIATLDFDGLLKVVDVKKFLQALAGGIGRAKAFGCGLMLIRRA